MGFRRSRDDAQLERRWRAYVDEERGLFDRAGMPGSVAHDQRLLEYLLMHGWLEDGSAFSVERLDTNQLVALNELVSKYVEQFGDPGVSMGPAVHRVRDRLSRGVYPWTRDELHDRRL